MGPPIHYVLFAELWGHRQRSLPHSSSASRFTAGAAGFFTVRRLETRSPPRLRLAAIGSHPRMFGDSIIVLGDAKHRGLRDRDRRIVQRQAALLPRVGASAWGRRG